MAPQIADAKTQPPEDSCGPPLIDDEFRNPIKTSHLFGRSKIAMARGGDNKGITEAFSPAIHRVSPVLSTK